MLRRVLAFIDVKFLAALMGSLIAATVFLSYVAAVQDNQAKGRRLDTVITAHNEDRREASAERRELLAGQRDLQRRYWDLVLANKALVVWLRDHGIYVPASLVPAESADTSSVRAESAEERAARTGTANGGPDRSGGGSGKARNPGSAGGSSGPGRSGDRSHGQNKGGKDKPKKDKGKGKG